MPAASRPSPATSTSASGSQLRAGAPENGRNTPRNMPSTGCSKPPSFDPYDPVEAPLPWAQGGVQPWRS